MEHPTLLFVETKKTNSLQSLAWWWTVMREGLQALREKRSISRVTHIISVRAKKKKKTRAELNHVSTVQHYPAGGRYIRLKEDVRDPTPLLTEKLDKWWFDCVMGPARAALVFDVSATRIIMLSTIVRPLSLSLCATSINHFIPYSHRSRERCASFFNNLCFQPPHSSRLRRSRD